MDQVFKRIPIPDDPDWKAFGVALRQAAWWHSDTHHTGRRAGLRAVLLKAGLYLAQNGLHRQLKTVFYPDFSPLLFHPGPKKAIRLLVEWQEARTVVPSLGNRRG